VVIWHQIRDPEPTSLAAVVQFGLFFFGGDPKLAYSTFRFPSVGERNGRREVKVWKLAPRRGPVKVERKDRGDWRTVRRLKAGGNRVLTGVVSARGKVRLRAVARG